MRLSSITEPLVPLSATDLAWQAGLFEGEGYIAIRRPNRKSLGTLIVQVCNVQPETTTTFMDAWGGHHRKVAASQRNHSDYYMWLSATWMAASFLLAIEPYLHTDLYRRRVGHALNFQHQKTRTREARTAEYHDRQDFYYEAMRQMNERGRGAA